MQLPSNISCRSNAFVYIFWINFSKIDGLNEDHVSDLFTPTHPCPVPPRSAWTSICDESPTFTGLMDIFVLAYMFWGWSYIVNIYIYRDLGLTDLSHVTSSKWSKCKLNWYIPCIFPLSSWAVAHSRPPPWSQGLASNPSKLRPAGQRGIAGCGGNGCAMYK